jgi:hypothetical protein
VNENPIVFVASGWAPEVRFHAALAEALKELGVRSHAVVLGSPYQRAYAATGSFAEVHDLAAWACQAGRPAPSPERLKNLEARYGTPCLWQYLAADRFLCRRSYAENLRAVDAQGAFWEQYLPRVKPSLLVGEVSHFHNWYAWAVGRAHGVPYAHLVPARVPGHTAIGDGPYEHQAQVCETCRRFQAEGVPADWRERARTFIADFQNRTSRASHLPPVRAWYQSPVGSGSLSTFLSETRRWLSSEREWDYTIVSPGEKLATWFGDRFRKMRLTGAGLFATEAELTEPFVFFGLHLQPEATTLVRGQFFQDMLSVVRNFALSLPAGYRLAVKEHDVMFGRRPVQFFRELQRMPNVVIVSPYASGPNLVRQAAAIAVVTGTVGWDGILLGKPVVVLGEPFFACYRGVAHVTDPTRLPQVMKELLAGPPPDPAERETFVAAVLACLVPASMDDFWGLRQDEFKDSARRIAEALLARRAGDGA